MDSAMNATVVKKFRLTPEEAKELRSLAKQMGLTESDVVRKGVDLVKRLQARKDALEGLIRLSKIGDPRKSKWAARF